VSILATPVAGGDNRHVPPRVSSPEFVGRAAELARLEAALERAERGSAAAAFVAGESGVGKTRLLRELERRAVERGARVLRGDCVAFGAGELAYAPLAAALRRLARELDPAVLDELLGGARDELARLAPELSPTPLGGARGENATAGEAHAQARLFGLLRALLDRLAAESPVLFAIEDLHWADRSTLEFVSSLLGGLHDERLLLVCTYRSDELHRRHPLRPFLAEEERRELVQRIELAPFSPAELAAQVAGILGSAAEPELVARLHARCEGNAFFVEELLAASGGATGSLPPTLRDVLSLRLEALPQDARAVLRVAAAAGRRGGHRLLATVTDLPEPTLLDALREAVAHHVLVHDSDGYAFRHALLEEAAYADLLPGERTALHLALAEALSADPSLAGGAAAAELAHHWRAAHRMPEALAAYVAAALEAERVSAFAEAGQHFERALEAWDLVEDADERSELGLGAVVAHAAQNALVSGEPHRAVTLGRRALELADGTGDVVSQALAHERLGGYLWAAGDSDAALAAHRDAVRVLPAKPPTPELARVLAAEANILMLRGPSEETRACSERAVATARAVGERAVEGRALNTFGAAMTMTGDWADGERALRDAMRIAEDLSEEYDTTRAYVNLGVCLDKQGRLAEAAELALEGAGVAERLGVRTHALFLAGDACWRLIRLGRLDEAQPIAERAVAAAPKGMAGVLVFDAAGQLALRRGRLDAADEHFQRSREQRSRTRDSNWIGNTACGQAEVALWRSDPEGAQRIAGRALDVVAGSEYVVSTARVYAAAMRAAAECALRASAVGDEPRAGEAQHDAHVTLERLRALLTAERWPEGTAGPEPVAFEAVCVAELSRAQAAPDPEAWNAAAEHFAALGLPFELGYTRWRQGEALIAGGGDRTAAQAALREAAEVAATLRAPLLLAEVEGLARRARVELRGQDAVADDDDDPEVDRLGLTARELTVLSLVAEGHTNREIGASLFISEKTASVHVSRILAKLGVRSRVEAATTAHRLGLSAASAPRDRGRG
jgi:DNA-binding CsgD family transcriptional regulator/tetratricopeptide (TPR) repeat protein